MRQRKQLVVQTLKPNKSDEEKGDRAQIMAIGDIHYGAKTCDEELVQENIGRCLEKGIYVIGMGDYIECAGRESPGESLFTQTRVPEEQKDWLIETFRPLTEAGLLLGLHSGNHEARISKQVGLNILSEVISVLNVPYLNHSAYHLYSVGLEKYTFFSTHGSSGSRTPWTKIKAALDQFSNNGVDCVLYGHLHGLDHMTKLYKEVNKRKQKVESLVRTAVLTGSFLRYEGSYAEQMNLPPAPMGSPIISLYGGVHEVRVQI